MLTSLSVVLLAACGAAASPESLAASPNAATPDRETAALEVVVASNSPCAVARPRGVTFSREVGPALIDDDDQPDAARVRLLAMGDAAMGGSGETTYAIELSLAGSGTWRTAFNGSIAGEGDASLALVDLNHDGRSEMLVHENSGYTDCDMEGGGNGTKWVVVGGGSRELFRGDGGWNTFSLGEGGDSNRSERAVVVRLPSGADAIALVGGGHLRVLSAAETRVEAAQFVRCESP